MFVLGVVVTSVVVALTMLCVVLKVAAVSASTLEEVLPVVIGVEVSGAADANVKDSSGIFAPGCPRAAYSIGVSLISYLFPKES
jgi:hypothetical protein